MSLYWCEGRRSWLCRKRVADMESRPCKHKAQLCWGHIRGIKLVEMWGARYVGEYTVRLMPRRDVLARAGTGLLKEQ